MEYSYKVTGFGGFFCYFFWGGEGVGGDERVMNLGEWRDNFKGKDFFFAKKKFIQNRRRKNSQVEETPKIYTLFYNSTAVKVTI